MRWKRYLIMCTLAALAAMIWYVLRPLPPISPTAVHPAPEITVLPETAPPATPTTEAKPSQPESAPAALPVTGTPAWELKIEEALRSQSDHGSIARVLLQQILSMPPEGQSAAAHHIANLMADKDYLEVLPYVQNLRIAKGFQEVIVAESLNRPKEVKLPILLAAARTPMHPMKDTAVSILSVLLDQNYGTDWTKWETAVKESLQRP